MSLADRDRNPAWDRADPPGVVALATLPVGHAWRMGGLVAAHVTTLAASYGAFPPIVVDPDTMCIIDGAHRVAAARRLGLTTLSVEWFEGDEVEALQAFVARNTCDGLPVGVGDRHAGVLRVLAARPDWSDRRIGHVCGVSSKRVARMRTNSGTRAKGAKRVGRDGRARPARPGENRDDIARAIIADPDASLRAIASRVGVSPETVRTVRRKMNAATALGLEGVGQCRVDDVVGSSGSLRQKSAAMPAPWRRANAFNSTSTGASFVDWLDATAVDQATHRLGDVPLNRVYEIADEARRRAIAWTEFAKALEARTRGRR